MKSSKKLFLCLMVIVFSFFLVDSLLPTTPCPTCPALTDSQAQQECDYYCGGSCYWWVLASTWCYQGTHYCISRYAFQCPGDMIEMDYMKLCEGVCN